MNKRKRQNLVKRYVFYTGFCIVILLSGIIFSVPIKIEVNSVGVKPPFLFALFFSILLSTSAIGTAYISYMSWFQGTKIHNNLKISIEYLANRFFIFRLPIYNPTLLFWYIRITSPVVAFLLLILLFVLLKSAF